MSDYPKLLWGPHGDEITVQSPSEEKTMVAEGYRPTLAEATAPAPASDAEGESHQKRGKH